MFSSFFKKDQKQQDKFIFPQYPCYAAIAEMDSKVDINEYFSGSCDNSLHIVRLFTNAAEAIEYLKGRPTYGSYLVCLDRDIASMQQLKEDGNGFGEHMVKAIKVSDYIMTTWKDGSLPPDQVKIIDNPYIKEETKDRKSLLVRKDSA